MSGTKAGGAKATATKLAKYGPDHFKEVGRKGGQASRGGGFAANRELARIAGAKGGRISKRGPAKKTYNKRTSWKTEPIVSSPASSSITKQQIETCASCHESFEKHTTLDDMGLCPDCPKTQAPRRGFFDRLRPF